MTYIEHFQNVLRPNHTLVPAFVSTTINSGYCESRGLLDFTPEKLQEFTPRELTRHFEQTQKQNKIACLLTSNHVVEDFSGQHSVIQNCEETVVQSWQPDPHHFLMKFFDCGIGKKAFYKIDEMNTGPDDFVLIGPWPVDADNENPSARRQKEQKPIGSKIFTVLNTVYVVETPRWETFNTSQVLIYSLSHVFGNRRGLKLK